MTPHNSPATSPLLSAPLSGTLTTTRHTASPQTLRSAPLTLQTSLYDGLFDGSYKLSTSPLATSTFSKSPPSWEPELSSSKIIEEFGQSKLFDDARLIKLRLSAVRRYNRTLTKQKRMLQSSTNGDNGLMRLNGEYIFIELKICELDLAIIALTRDLKESYEILLGRVDSYECCYNLDSEKLMAEKPMYDAFYDFDDMLKLLQYLQSQRSSLVGELQRHDYNCGRLKRWIRRVFHSGTSA